MAGDPRTLGARPPLLIDDLLFRPPDLEDEHVSCRASVPELEERRRRTRGSTKTLLTGACAGGQPASWPVLSLTQTGNAVTGTATAPSAWCSIPAGQNGVLDAGATIDSDGNLTNVRVKFPLVDFFLTGTMGATGRQVTGNSRTAFGTNTFELNKR